jgi:uncharacterized protein YprB with RNaseH-like and TPR domain
MLSDLIRARLAELGRPTSGNSPAPTRAKRPAQTSWVCDVVATPSDRWLERGRVIANPLGQHWCVRHDLSEFWPQSQRHLERQAASLALAARPLDTTLAMLGEHFPTGAVFLDLETCGFAGSPIFLAGIAQHVETGFVIEQFFARNYAEEPSVLASLWQAIDGKGVLVTFNGKSFDWPMVCDRMARHRMPQSHRAADLRSATQPTSGHEPLHCDLLHPARRRWKAFLPNCRLQTLEQFVCRRHRCGDLPGALVPAAYHEFVRSGEPGQIGAILHHNALDLATLVELALRLLVA